MKPVHRAVSYGAAFAMATLLGTAASAAPNSSDTTPTPQSTASSGQYDQHATQTFIDEAAYANRAEVAEARYVSDHTSSQAVKDFAKKMIDDHSASLHKLEQVASAGGFVMPNGVDKKDRSSMKDLKQEKGARLNMHYSSSQEKDHKKVIAKFEHAAQDSQIAPAVRAYARETLPTLKDHLHMAQQLVATESKGNRSAG